MTHNQHWNSYCHLKFLLKTKMPHSQRIQIRLKWKNIFLENKFCLINICCSILQFWMNKLLQQVKKPTTFVPLAWISCVLIPLSKIYFSFDKRCSFLISTKKIFARWSAFLWLSFTALFMSKKEFCHLW